MRRHVHLIAALGLGLASGLLAAPGAGAATAPRACTLPVPKATGPWAQRVVFAGQQARALRRAGHQLARRPSPHESAGHRTHPRGVRLPEELRARPCRRQQRPASASVLGAAGPRAVVAAPRPVRARALRAGPGTGNCIFQSVLSVPAGGDHQGFLTISSAKTAPLIDYARVADGAVNKDNCLGVTQLAQLMGPTTEDHYLWTGPHTVLQANVYASAARTGTPVWTTSYPTIPKGTARGYPANPLYVAVGAGERFADAWNAGTGELVAWDTLDWLKSAGSCYECDLSGYTVESLNLRHTAGTFSDLAGADASGATFRNVTFDAAYDLAATNLKGAVFENVTMNAPNLAGADLTGVRFVGTNRITAPILTGAKLNGITLSAGTSITSATVGGTPPSCTALGSSDLTDGTFTIAVIAGCKTTPLFPGSQVQPTIVPPTLWTSLDWSSSTVVFDGRTRSMLAGADLSGLHMKSAHLWGVPADLTGTNLSGAVLDGSFLTNAVLQKATLRGVSAVGTKFSGADLTGALVDGATTNLTNAVFDNATLDDATFQSATIQGASFNKVSAHGSTSFSFAQAEGANFADAHVLGNPSAFRGTFFSATSVATAVSFAGAFLGGTSTTSLDFTSAQLVNASFKGAQCVNCNFDKANLGHTDFTDAWLPGTSFSGVASYLNTDDPPQGTTFKGALMSDVGGTWTFPLGFEESIGKGVSIDYVGTSFTGTSTEGITDCPTGPPDPDCTGKTIILPWPQPVCSPVGHDACDTPVTTLTGTGTPGGSATQVAEPQAVVVDPNGVRYFADAGNSVIRRVASGGQSVVIAGAIGDYDDTGDGGDALAARFMAPVGLAIAADGKTLYVSDRDANRIRKLVPSTVNGKAGYTVYAVAGSGLPCAADPCGDGADPLQATFSGPEALWVDPTNNVYVADTQNNRIRIVVAGGGVTTLPAGTLDSPAGITGDVFGNLYVADSGGSYVDRIDPAGVVTHVLGTGVAGYNGFFTSSGGLLLGTQMQLREPRGLTTDLAGTLFVADAGNGLIIRWNTSTMKVAQTAGKVMSGSACPGGKGQCVDQKTNVDDSLSPPVYADQVAFRVPNAVAVFNGQYVVTDAGFSKVRTFGPIPTS